MLDTTGVLDIRVVRVLAINAICKVNPTTFHEGKEGSRGTALTSAPDGRGW